jgi:cytochrome c553
MRADLQLFGNSIMTKQRFFSSMAISKLSAAVVLACVAGQSAQAQTVLDYAARWKFDDCAASVNLADASGNSNTATRGSLVQCTTDRDGKAKSAALFTVASAGDGSPQTNVTLLNTSLAFTNNITLSAVIKPSATPEGALITKGWVSGTTKGKVFQLGLIKDTSGSGKIQFTVWTTPASGGAAVPEVLTSGIAVPASKWSRVSVSYTPGKSMEIYLDGSLIAQRTGPLAAIADITNGSSIWLGGGVGAQTKGYLGTIDDTWVSNGSCADIGTARAPDPARELMITNLSVVEDPVRTVGRGAWTFANLMEQMVPATAGNPQAVQDAAADMVLAMLQTWNAPQVVNGFTVPARPAIQSTIDGWPKLANGKLDLTQAPVRLLAIVNRMDVRNVDKGSAGEGRFVFAVLDPNGNTQSFTMIFEYNLPAQTLADIRQWGKLWHDLGTNTLGTPGYNVALQAVTDKFSLNGLQTGRANGNPINQVRTNEIALSSPWELREFNLGVTAAGATRLQPVPVKNNPDLAFNLGSSDATKQALLTKYINGAATSILLESHLTPAQLDANGKAIASGGTPFAAGSSLNNFPTWNASSLVLPANAKLADGTAATLGDLKHKFALNTCNGCHSSPETGTFFLQINPRFAGQEATLSTFLSSTTRQITDPRDASVKRIFNDLGRRVEDLQKKVIASCPVPPAPVAALALRTASVASVSTSSSTSTTSLGKGTGRVH